MVKNGRGQSGHGALKLTSDFAFWCKFRKAKSYFNDFLGGRGQKWAWLFSSREPKICCIERMSL